MLYSAMILFITLPFAGCAVYFFEVPIAHLALGYGILLLYSNVVVLVTLAASIFDREWLMVPSTIFWFFLLAIFALVLERDFMTVFPPHIAEITPLPIRTSA